MFVLNIVTHTENVDVNVTPDKLQMFIRHEAALMAIIKSSLVKMYSRLYTTVNLSDTSIGPSPKSQAIMSSFLIKPANTSAKLVSNQLNEEDEENNKIDLKLGETKRPILEPSPERVRQVLSVLSPKQQGNHTEKPEPPKRNREDLSPPSEFFRERVLKQPKLTSESPPRRPNSKSPPDIRDLLRKPPQSPQFLTVKPIYGGASSTSSDAGSGSCSPFSLTEKKSMFQNRIGSPIKIASSEEPSQLPLASSSMISTMDSSFADRIDLHMCNRETAVLDSPAVETRTHRRILEQDEDYSKHKGIYLFRLKIPYFYLNFKNCLYVII